MPFPYTFPFEFGVFRSASASMGLAGQASTIRVVTRTAQASLGVTGTATRGWIGSRSGSAAFSLVGVPGRVLSALRSASAALSLVGMSERILGALRSASAALGLVGTSARSWIGSRLASATLELVGVTDRGWVGSRSAEAVMSIIPPILSNAVLVANMDEGQGNIVHDYSSVGNDGTKYGALWVPGKFGKGLESDGFDDYIQFPYSADQQVDSIAVEFWIKLTEDPDCDGNNNWRWVLNLNGTSACQCYIILEQNRTVNFSVRVGNTSYRYIGGSFSSEQLTVGTWTHLIYSYDHVTGDGYAYKDFILSRSGEMVPGGGVLDKLVDYGWRLSHPRGIACPTGAGSIPAVFDGFRIYSSVPTEMDIKLLEGLGAQRYFVGERSASTGFSLVGVADRIKVMLRSASASMGLTGAAGRDVEVSRSASASMGLTGTAARGWVGARLASASVGLNAVGTRLFEGVRGAAASIGVTGAADRMLHAFRAASASMNATGTAVREWIGTRSNSVVLSLVGATDRFYSAIRSAPAVIAFQGGNMLQNPSLEDPWYLVNYTDENHEINRPDWWTVSYSYANSDKLLALEENSIVRERESAIKLEYLMIGEDFTGHLNINHGANRIDIDENSYLEGGDFQKGIIGPTGYSDQTFIFYDSENQYLCRRWAYATAINDDAGDGWRLLSAIWQPSHLDPNSPTTGGNIPYIPKGAATAYFMQYFVWHGGPTERKVIFDKFFAFQWSELPTDQQRIDKATTIWDISKRAFVGTRSAAAAVAVQGIANRAFSGARSAAASIASSANATRALVIERAASAAVGLVAVGKRAFSGVRSAIASIGMTGDTARKWVGARAASAVLVATGTANRTLHSIRSAAASLSQTATAKRIFNGARSAAALIGITGKNRIKDSSFELGVWASGDRTDEDSWHGDYSAKRIAPPGGACEQSNLIPRTALTGNPLTVSAYVKIPTMDVGNVYLRFHYHDVNNAYITHRDWKVFTEAAPSWTRYSREVDPASSFHPDYYEGCDHIHVDFCWWRSGGGSIGTAYVDAYQLELGSLTDYKEGIATRSWIGTRPSSAAISAVATAKRSQILERVQSASVRLAAVGGRAFEGVRSAAASMSATAVGQFFKHALAGIVTLRLARKTRILNVAEKTRRLSVAHKEGTLALVTKTWILDMANKIRKLRLGRKET